ncbi:colicin-like pore-forming protein [Pantoea sp. EA-12]|uniref:colicin-like pore-forming protein n=1 Tax=Pantoea sp. EA-12 TaxID=3043303 RepID=UPI0024B4BD55|nr:colicin-like pore-forming protein [Pantoea sp. EA-12]MDI9221010.1 colicin-like pore-forming protein [Pantoea sp. EA-12]
MVVGDGTSWSSERGSRPGYGGSTGNSGGNGSVSNNGLSNTQGTPVNKDVAGKMARLAGIDTSHIIGYFLDSDGRVIGIDTRISGDAYGVAIGYLPPNPRGHDISSNVNSPGGNVPFNFDVSETRKVELRRIISKNARLANSSQSGISITKARQVTAKAQMELALIDMYNKHKPSEPDLANAIRITTDFYKEVTGKLGERAAKQARDYADLVKGKRLRSVESANRAMSKYSNSLIKRYGMKDRHALANAIKAKNLSKLAEKYSQYSKALGYYGHAADVINVVLELTEAIKTNSWKKFFIKLEALIAGKVATAAVAFAFVAITGVPLGILGYALIMAAVGAMVNDALINSMNMKLGIKL